MQVHLCAQGLLRLCTRVVRGLMSKLVPDLESDAAVPGSGTGAGREAASAGAGTEAGGNGGGGGGGGKGADQAGSEGDSLEIEGEGGAAEEGVESRGHEERRKAVEFENKVCERVGPVLVRLCVRVFMWVGKKGGNCACNQVHVRVHSVPVLWSMHLCVCMCMCMHMCRCSRLAVPWHCFMYRTLDPPFCPHFACAHVVRACELAAGRWMHTRVCMHACVSE